MVTTSYDSGQRPNGSRDGRGPLGSLQDGAQAALHDVREQGSEQFETYRDSAAEQLEALAEGARAAGEQLGDQDVLGVSHYISDMAQSMGSLAEGLRGKSADQLLQQAGQLARENPALFLAGSVAVGFGLSRLLRASASPQRDPLDDRTPDNGRNFGDGSAAGYADGYVGDYAGDHAGDYADEYGAGWADAGVNPVIAADEGVPLTPAHVSDTSSVNPGSPAGNFGGSSAGHVGASIGSNSASGSGSSSGSNRGINSGRPSSAVDPAKPGSLTPDTLNQGNRNKGDLE